MLHRLPLRFALGIALAGIVLLVRPEWYTDGLLGNLLVGFTTGLATLGVFNALAVAPGAFARPDTRPASDTSRADFGVYGGGLVTLFSIARAAGGRPMVLVVIATSVLVGGAAFAVMRWNAARVRRGATSS